ncbi:hypothetical protein NCS55_01478100 [Fusarium keratoplasticum]|nr:hypothetical protein NCS55_01478100 [Fusarium keratoplasticum]
MLTRSSVLQKSQIISSPAYPAALCSFNGFMTQVFVIQTDYWVFLLSLCTYFILAGFKTPSSWVQDNRLILAALPWVLSVTWAGIGLGTTGYGNIGAWCWFTSDEIRLLVNFVPRWAIIFAILFMYGNLYYILHRAHKRTLSLRYFSSDGVSRQRNTEGFQQDQERPGPSANPQPLSNPAESEDMSNKMKNLARRMLLYPLAYMLVWSLPTAIRIYQSTRGVAAPFALQTVDKACIVLQGFIDAVIYGVNESSLAHWRNLIFHKPDEEIEEIQLGSNNYGFHSRTGLNSKTSQQIEVRNNSLSTLETDQLREDHSGLELYRVKFYEFLNMTLAKKLGFSDNKFDLYLLGFDAPGAASHRKSTFNRHGLVELTHNYGTENDPKYKVNNGNMELHNGFSYICLSMDSLEAACQCLENEGYKWFTTTGQAATDYNGDTSRTWDIVNENCLNEHSGKPVSYKLVSRDVPRLMPKEGSLVWKRAAFARHAIHVTKYADD